MRGVFEIRQGDRIKTVEIVYGGDKSAARLADEIYEFLVENVAQLFGLPNSSDLGKSIRSLLENGGHVLVRELRDRGDGDLEGVFEIRKDGKERSLALPCSQESAQKLTAEVYGMLVVQEKIKGWVN